MKYLELFENYSKIFESVESDLLDQLDSSFIENYWDKHLAYTDAEDVYFNFPNMVWNHLDDERAFDDLKSDEINNYSVEDFSDDDFKKYIKGKYLEDDERIQIYKKHIESEIDLDELEDLKVDFKDETDLDEKIRLKKSIKNIKKKIKEINELDLEDLLDEMSEEDLKEIITDTLDEHEFVESVVNDRFDDYGSLEGYVESFWGDISSIDWDWLLNYLDDDALLQDYNNNVQYDHKYDALLSYISNTTEIQEKLLEVDSKNATELFDLFDDDTENNLGDDYDFQKAYIEAYAENYADGEESDLGEGKGKALKNLYDKFGLVFEIEDEYEGYMHYVLADKYNI